jgi:hypothetical protein
MEPTYDHLQAVIRRARDERSIALGDFLAAGWNATLKRLARLLAYVTPKWSQHTFHVH